MEPEKDTVQYKERNNITISDVAQALGISKTTVSRAISGKGRIGEQTRQRVLDYIKENHYQPSVVAKGLAQSGDYEMENEQYRLLARLAAAIVDRVMSDSTSGVCNLLSGLAVASVDIAPESSIFGGWCGYSVEISFE